MIRECSVCSGVTRLDLTSLSAACRDEQIDVGVIVGLYAIFVIIEALRLPMAIKESRRRPSADVESSEDVGKVAA